MTTSKRAPLVFTLALAFLPSMAALPQHAVVHSIEHNFADELEDALEEDEATDILIDVQAAKRRSFSEYTSDLRQIAEKFGGKPSFWANLWLASRGDRKSLSRLLSGQIHGGFGVTSQEWAEAFHLWGNFKLYAASEVLVEWVSAANVLAGYHARMALRRLYPEVNPVKFDWASETERFQEEYRLAIKHKQATQPGLFPKP